MLLQGLLERSFERVLEVPRVAEISVEHHEHYDEADEESLDDGEVGEVGEVGSEEALALLHGPATSEEG